jgi:hypothetical protein
MARTDAQRVVLELIRQTGGTWDGNNSLSRAFYFAHLYYARDEPGLLTAWPIVRTPQGPGIHNQVVLLKGLVKNGLLTSEVIHEGPYPDARYRLTDKAAVEPPLPEDVRAAIRAAIELVRQRTAADLAQLTQERSRSWRGGKDGDILDIYIDLIPDEEFEEAQAKLAELDRQVTAILLDEQVASAAGGKQP